MVNALLLSGRLVYSITALASMTFGASNLVRFQKNILTNFNLTLYYVCTLLCLLSTIVQCWLASATWYQQDWMLVNGLVRALEISFVWCQTLAFLHLAYQLKQSSDMACDGQDNEKRIEKCFRLGLMTGICVFGVLFCVYIFYVLTMPNYSLETSQGVMIKCEIGFWCLSIVTNIVLIVAITYTFRQLKNLFHGEQFSDYYMMIKRIAVLFAMSIMVKSIYEWSLFIKEESKDT